MGNSKGPQQVVFIYTQHACIHSSRCVYVRVCTLIIIKEEEFINLRSLGDIGSWRGRWWG